jgi:uncharacterized protein GlcG (DUF336 family)
MPRLLPALTTAVLAAAGCIAALGPAIAAAPCPVNHDQLTKALKASVKPSGGPSNGGLDTNEWAAVVARDGSVCIVTFSGGKPDDQWLASRAIAIEKANTANAMSLKTMALSTANLYAGGLPGAFLYGMANTNPPVAQLLYAGDPASYGSDSDPAVGKVVGGVVTFGGGLALYDQNGDIVGAIGASGDTSCADHNIAWRIRHGLGLDHVPAGVSPGNNDAIIYDMLPDKTSASGYGHAWCKGKEAEIAQQIQAGYIPNWANAMK